MCEHERWRVVGRISAPPSFPFIIFPIAANWPEHIAPKNEGAESRHRTTPEIVVDSRLAIAFALHFAKRARGEKPPEQLFSPFAERGFEALLRSRREAIKRNGEASDPNLTYTILQ